MSRSATQRRTIVSTYVSAVRSPTPFTCLSSSVSGYFSHETSCEISGNDPARWFGSANGHLLSLRSEILPINRQEKLDYLMQRHQLTFASVTLDAVRRQKSALRCCRLCQRQDLI